MFDPVMAVAFILLVILFYLVGLALATVIHHAWEGAKALVARSRRQDTPVPPPVDPLSDLEIRQYHGFTVAEWKGLMDVQRAGYRDSFYRSKGL